MNQKRKSNIEEVNLNELTLNEDWQLVKVVQEEWNKNIIDILKSEFENKKIESKKKKNKKEIEIKKEKTDIEEEYETENEIESIDEEFDDNEIEKHIKEISNQQDEIENKKFSSLEEFLNMNRCAQNETHLMSISKIEEYNHHRTMFHLSSFIKFRLSNLLKFSNKKEMFMNIINSNNENLISLIQKELKRKKKDNQFLDILISIFLYKNLRFINFFIQKEFKDFWYIDRSAEDLFQTLSIMFTISLKKFDHSKNFKYTSFVYYQLFRWMNYITKQYSKWQKESVHNRYKFQRIVNFLYESFKKDYYEQWIKLTYEDVTQNINFINYMIDSWISKKSIIDWSLHKAIDYFNWDSVSWVLDTFLSWWSSNETVEKNTYIDSEWIQWFVDFDDSKILKDYKSDLLMKSFEALTPFELVLISSRFKLVDEYYHFIKKLIYKNNAFNEEIKLNEEKKIIEEKIEITKKKLIEEKKTKKDTYETWVILRNHERNLKEIKRKIKENNKTINWIFKTLEVLDLIYEISIEIEKDSSIKLKFFTLEYLWKAFWITRERARQMETRIFEKLREAKAKELFIQRMKFDGDFLKKNWFKNKDFIEIFNDEYEKYKEVSWDLLKEFVETF